MRLSQFNQLLVDEFGDVYGQVILRDLALTELSDQTGAQALAAGEDPRVVWLALCRASGVPKSRWHGFDKKKARSEDQANK